MKLSDSSRNIDAATVLYGVFGDPVAHSKSPLMLNSAFQEAGVNGVYAAFHIAPGTLKDAVAGIRALGFRGVNVTIPHKVAVMQYLDEIDDDARMIGAVNTIVNDQGRLIGRNTDGIGYVRSLKEETGFDPRGKRILVLGAGGAARGIAYALSKEAPAKLRIANRSPDKARELAGVIGKQVSSEGVGLDDLKEIFQDTDLLVHTTRVGMHPGVDEIPIGPELLHNGLLVSDIVYNPPMTRLLREARDRGAAIHQGLGMFIYQGAYAFEYWTGQHAPVQAMRDVLTQSFSNE